MTRTRPPLRSARSSAQSAAATAQLGQRDPHRDRAALPERRPVGVAVGEVAEDDDAAVDLRERRDEAARQRDGAVEIGRAVALGQRVECLARRAEVGRRSERDARRRAGEDDGDGVPFARRGEELASALARALEA